MRARGHPQLYGRHTTLTITYISTTRAPIRLTRYAGYGFDSGYHMDRSDSVAVGVAGAVIKDGRLLLVHRSPASRINPDVWDLFGGHVNPGEHPDDALRREANEELGIEVLAIGRLGSVYIPAGTVVVHVYEVRSWRGEPVNAAPKEHTKIHWFDAGDLPEREGWNVYRDLVVTALDRSDFQRDLRSSVPEAPPL